MVRKEADGIFIQIPDLTKALQQDNSWNDSHEDINVETPATAVSPEIRLSSPGQKHLQFNQSDQIPEGLLFDQLTFENFFRSDVIKENKISSPNSSSTLSK